MQLDSEEGRLITSATASLDGTYSGKVYVHKIRLKFACETEGRNV
jgi:hypothetical protein